MSPGVRLILEIIEAELAALRAEPVAEANWPVVDGDHRPAACAECKAPGGCAPGVCVAARERARGGP